MILLLPQLVFHGQLPAVAALAEDQNLRNQKRGRQQHIIQQYNAEQLGFGTVKANARQCAKGAANKQYCDHISQCSPAAFRFRLLGQNLFCKQTVEQQTVKNKDQQLQPEILRDMGQPAAMRRCRAKKHKDGIGKVLRQIGAGCTVSGAQQINVAADRKERGNDQKIQQHLYTGSSRDGGLCPRRKLPCRNRCPAMKCRQRYCTQKAENCGGAQSDRKVFALGQRLHKERSHTKAALQQSGCENIGKHYKFPSPAQYSASACTKFL